MCSVLGVKLRDWGLPLCNLDIFAAFLKGVRLDAIDVAMLDAFTVPGRVTGERRANTWTRVRESQRRDGGQSQQKQGNWAMRLAVAG